MGKQLKEVESDVSALTRRIMLMEELDENRRATVKRASDNEQKLDELSRKLGVQEAELKRAVERAELAEKNLKDIEEELVEKIYNLQSKYKVTEARFEYGEMNITKLNQRIDDIEDEIYREKLKIKKCSDELDV